MPVGRKRKHNKELPQRMTQKRGKYYYICKPAEKEYYGKSWIPLGENLPSALEKYGKIVKGQRGTMSLLWEKYKRLVLIQNAPRTQKDKTKYWDKYLGIVFGQCLPDDIQRIDIREYLDEVGGRQANLHISLLSHMFTWAIEWEMASINPCLGVRRNPEGARKVRVHENNLIDWLQHCRPVLRAYSLIQNTYGIRKPDLLKMERRNLTKHGYEFESTKSGKAGLLPWTQELREAIKLADLHRKHADGTTALSRYIISTQTGRPYTVDGFDSVWSDDMATFDGDRFAPNDLRKKHGTDIEIAGGDATKNLQHSSRSVTRKHYLQHVVIQPLVCEDIRQILGKY